jgi:hypothetical protein
VINTTNPYSTGVAPDFANAQNDIKSQMNQFKREEDEAKAPHVLPFSLEHKIEPLLATALLSFEQIRGELLTQLKSNPAINQEKADILIDKIQQINSDILDLSPYLRTITL